MKDSKHLEENPENVDLAEDYSKNEDELELEASQAPEENNSLIEEELVKEEFIEEEFIEETKYPSITKEQEEELEKLDDNEASKRLDEIVGKNDELLEKDYLNSHISQSTGKEISIEVENIYYNPEKRLFKNRMKMKAEPPTLVIRDSEGAEVRFDLTENLTDELAETFKQVKRAYYGFSSPSDIDIPDKFLDKALYLIKKNKVKLILTSFIILFLFVLNLM